MKIDEIMIFKQIWNAKLFFSKSVNGEKEDKKVKKKVLKNTDLGLEPGPLNRGLVD